MDDQMFHYVKYSGSTIKNQAPTTSQHSATVLKRSSASFSPEVGLGELLHVELLVCERSQVDITNGGEHFTWNKRMQIKWDK